MAARARAPAPAARVSLGKRRVAVQMTDAPAASTSTAPAAAPSAAVVHSEATRLRFEGVLRAEDPELASSLREKYGNHAGEVASILRLWEAYDELFYAWKEEWSDDTDEYRAKRALRLLRAGMQPHCLLAMCTRSCPARSRSPDV